jgi:hypothetical protein
VAGERGEKYNKNSESSSLISSKENNILGPQGVAGSHRQKQKQKLAIWPKNTHSPSSCC